MTSPLTKKQWEASVAEMWSASVKATCQDLIDEAVKAEREACAKIADKEVDFWLKTDAEKENYLEQALFIAKEIRARGQA